MSSGSTRAMNRRARALGAKPRASKEKSNQRRMSPSSWKHRLRPRSPTSFSRARRLSSRTPMDRKWIVISSAAALLSISDSMETAAWRT